jgi:hypothetical protein
MPALPIQKLFQRVDQGFAVTPFRATSDALPFGHLWYGESDAVGNAIGYAKFCSRSHDAVIRLGVPKGVRLSHFNADILSTGVRNFRHHGE